MKWSLLFLVVFAACAPPSDTQMAAPVAGDGGRFSVTRLGVFDDTLAYGGQRGIYIIRDAETGQEFVGLSGVGVAAIGRHSTGKTSTSDER